MMPSSRAIAPTSAASSPSPSRSCTSTVCVDGAAASRDMIRAASTAPPRSTSSTSSASGADPCCSQIVPANPGGRRASVAGRWMPTASRGRRPNSGRSATRTTSPLACSASKMPHWPIHSRCSGGPARPRMVSRRSSSASSLDAEYASTWDWSSSMLIMPWVRSAIDCASPNRSVPESYSGSPRSPWCSNAWLTSL